MFIYVVSELVLYSPCFISPVWFGARESACFNTSTFFFFFFYTHTHTTTCIPVLLIQEKTKTKSNQTKQSFELIATTFQYFTFQNPLQLSTTVFFISILTRQIKPPPKVTYFCVGFHFSRGKPKRTYLFFLLCFLFLFYIGE